MRKLLGIAAVAVVISIAGLVGTGVGVYRGSQTAPDFYLEALEVESGEHEEAGASLEEQFRELNKEARRAGRWEAVFTEKQINGWLAADLPEKYPHLSPKGVEQPRVALDIGEAQVACRYNGSKLSTIISFALDIELVERPNTLEVRVREARAGVFPVPLKRFLGKITAAAEQADIELEWIETEDDPVALVKIPAEHEDYAHRRIIVDSLEVVDGEVRLAGRTEAGAMLHALASYPPKMRIFHR